MGGIGGNFISELLIKGVTNHRERAVTGTDNCKVDKDRWPERPCDVVARFVEANGKRVEQGDAQALLYKGKYVFEQMRVNFGFPGNFCSLTVVCLRRCSRQCMVVCRPVVYGLLC